MDIKSLKHLFKTLNKGQKVKIGQIEKIKPT